MAKNLDGIKKLNPEEIKKNRKIVLSYIGEKDKDPEQVKEVETASRIVSVFNKVDGIKLNKIFNAKPEVKNILEKPESVMTDDQAGKQERVSLDKIEREELARKELARKTELLAIEKAKAEEVERWQEKLRLEEKEKKEKLKLEEINRLEKERAKRIKLEREELIKKEIVEKIKLEAEKKAKAEKNKKKHEKLKLEEKKKEEKRIIEENNRLEKIKRAEEIKKIKREIKLAKIEAAKRRKLKRQKAIKNFRDNLNNRLGEIFSTIKKNFIYGMLCLITFLIISYVVFCLLVLRFKINDNIIEKMLHILPVPAVITNQGIINYNDFRGIRNNDYVNLNSIEKRSTLAKWLILRNLSKKYNLSVNFSEQALAIAFIMDKDFNQVGLSRIKKISELLNNIDSIKQLSKYADEFSDVAYYNSERAIEKFGRATFNLNANQISDIVFSNNGYYIVQIVDSKSGQLGIRYLFVGARTLDQYVVEKLSKIKMFILAN